MNLTDVRQNQQHQNSSFQQEIEQMARDTKRHPQKHRFSYSCATTTVYEGLGKVT
jgi:hypothetical protein